MRRLTGSDVFHLNRERGGQPSHTIKVAEIASGDGGLDPDELAAWVTQRLPGQAPFRWRLQPVPFRLGRPVWVDTDQVDAEYHVRREHVADQAGLDGLISRLAGEPLDLDRPLWRMWVVDGPGRGRVAMVLQIHHALADGAASVRIWEEVFAEDPPAAPPAPIPSAPELLAATLRHHVGNVRDVPRLLSRLRDSATRKKRRPSSAPVTDYLQAPPTIFNDLPGTQRTCAFVTLPLSELRDLARWLGGTVNDVYAAACAGAVRAYLLERDALPDAALTATAPVGLERPEPDYGNAMSSWFWTLATDVADPLERFHAVQATLRTAREVHAEDPSLLADLQEHSRLYETIWWFLRRGERGGRRPMLNLVVSNVRGPAPLSWQGHPVVALRSLGPLTGRLGLNLTAWSYCDAFTVGLHACRNQVPDPDRLDQLLVEAVDELRTAVTEGSPA